ncbi:hypothetical protein, partial [Klebsiella pneumoniae]|uniref:hypothetical protein n=1 Tax=Klebsiella pneumoniae TaxID=573 RepID=UPI003012C432
GTGSAAGQAVYLSGVPGLKDGTYTLLPGAYATLPGAYRVVINAGVTNPLPYQLGTQADGTVYAAGYLTNTLTGARSSTTTEF